MNEWMNESNQSINQSINQSFLVLLALFMNIYLETELPGPVVIKFVSWSSQLSMKFVLLINLKSLTIANSFMLTRLSMKIANNYENASYIY